MPVTLGAMFSARMMPMKICTRMVSGMPRTPTRTIWAVSELAWIRVPRPHGVPGSLNNRSEQAGDAADVHESAPHAIQRGAQAAPTAAGPRNQNALPPLSGLSLTSA